jgi:transposase
MARGTVYGWLARYREGGKDALRARPVPGRPPKLTGVQMRRLYTLITGTDPRQLEFAFALWTREMRDEPQPAQLRGQQSAERAEGRAVDPGKGRAWVVSA